ncbi:phage tail tape measure protein [Peribacillus butanolivorans]|nr:phage tail tape measure protein [Peribacillus butanolivorans]AXN40680.1 phage tail tape measure protein [Peribacillus butanolivorans]
MEENTALSNEAEQRYATMASKVGTVKNNIFALAKDIGDILSPYVIKAADLFNSLIDRMSGMSKHTKIAMVVIAALAAAIGPLLVAGGFFIGFLGSTATGLGKLKSWWVIKMAKVRVYCFNRSRWVNHWYFSVNSCRYFHCL